MPTTQEINQAFDDATANSPLVHLNAQQADAFIDFIQDESKILKNARVRKMRAPIEKISKIGIGDDVFFPSRKGSEPNPGNRIQVNGNEQIELKSQEIIAEVRVLDEELEDNISGPAFREHLLKLVAKKGANQIEKAALYGKKVDNGDSILSLFNGFLSQISTAGQKINALDFTDRFFDKEKLTKAFKTIPTKFKSVINKIYLPTDLAIDYENSYATGLHNSGKKSVFGLDLENSALMSTTKPVAVSGGLDTTISASASKDATVVSLTSVTGLQAGDVLTLNFGGAKEHSSAIASISGNDVTLETALPFDYDSANNEENSVVQTTLDGADILLTDAQNLVWGIQRDITIETERKVRERATYFVITMRCDFAVENPEAVALIENLQVK